MFALLKKYGSEVAHLARRLADVIEHDGVYVVDALRFVGGAIPGVALEANAAAAAVGVVDAVVTRFDPAGPVPTEVAPVANLNPQRQPAPPAPPAPDPVPAAVAAMDAKIATGAFDMTPGSDATMPPAPATDFRNPQRG